LEFALRLIFVREQESRYGSVRFGDDPNLDVIPGSIGAEDPETIFKRKFILSFVLFTKLAPISSSVPFEKLKGVVIGMLQGS